MGFELHVHWGSPIQTLVHIGPQDTICMALGISQNWLELGVGEHTPGSYFRDSGAMKAFLLPWLWVKVMNCQESE